MPPTCKVTIIAIASAALVAAGQPRPADETYDIPLSGRAETNITHPLGGTGDPDGSGLVTLAVHPAKRQVCFDFSLKGVATPMMAHIRKAPKLRNGPPIVSLFTGTGSNLDGCARANTRQLADMIFNPSDYSVDIATTEFPDGALRGQLSRT